MLTRNGRIKLLYVTAGSGLQLFFTHTIFEITEANPVKHTMKGKMYEKCIDIYKECFGASYENRNYVVYCLWFGSKATIINQNQDDHYRSQRNLRLLE